MNYTARLLAGFIAGLTAADLSLALARLVAGRGKGHDR